VEDLMKEYINLFLKYLYYYFEDDIFDPVIIRNNENENQWEMRTVKYTKLIEKMKNRFSILWYNQKKRIMKFLKMYLTLN
jgi:hypothetical protein